MTTNCPRCHEPLLEVELDGAKVIDAHCENEGCSLFEVMGGLTDEEFEWLSREAACRVFSGGE